MVRIIKKKDTNIRDNKDFNKELDGENYIMHFQKLSMKLQKTELK